MNTQYERHAIEVPGVLSYPPLSHGFSCPIMLLEAPFEDYNEPLHRWQEWLLSLKPAERARKRRALARLARKAM